MKQAIMGFFQDEEKHWVAVLTCGHNQHVRHNPPLVSRPWVRSQEGRNAFIGHLLNCKKCDDQAPPDG